MANSKHAHFRYNILDYCFRNKNFTFKELLVYVNNRLEEVYPGEQIATRTLRNDLEVFRDKSNGFGAPLPKKATILRYSKPQFSIAQRPLLEYENYLIEASHQLLSRFENNPKYDRLLEALIKFQDEEDQGVFLERILFYDHNDEYKGIKYLKPLYLAIKNKQVLRITYKGFNKTNETVYEFHPSVLKQYNRRWFVFGINSTKNKINWSIPLDERLIDFEVIEEIEYKNSQTNWDLFFREMVGVIRPNESKVEKVVLKFYNGRENYFKTKPFQPDFEEFFENDKQDQVWFYSIINRELVQQLLSYGSDVEVLEPTCLRQQIQEHVISMMKNYQL